MSKYNEALHALTIEEELLKIELKELINLSPKVQICKLCLFSRLLKKQNQHIHIYALHLEFPELKDSFNCSACSKTITLRCHKFINAQNKYVALIKQLFDEATIELQVVKEKLRLMANRKEMYKDELHHR